MGNKNNHKSFKRKKENYQKEKHFKFIKKRQKENDSYSSFLEWKRK